MDLPLPTKDGITKPPPSDTSHEANLARIKFFRNQVYGHVTTTGVDAPTFNALWKEISAVLVSLGLSQGEIDRLKAEQCGEEDFLDALREWAESEGNLKAQLNDMRQLQNKVQQTVEDIQIQQSTIQETVEDIHEIVTEIRETQHDTDQEDNIRKKLARLDTQRDVRDYTKRYLQGTRESVFAEIHRWLDDASSPNRVLVLSGNAGMGKSVIAAEMCRRMQEAGRLAGSHFCHHDRARHRNPKVMMQSLACHLSSLLPEYKKTLVEQFSGNLGVEINDIEVVDLFDLLFLEPLNRVADPGFISLVVIDALDESQYQGRNDLLDVISRLFKNLPLWLRFFVTTRPEVNIWDSLKDLQPLLLGAKDDDNLKDIRFYFEWSLSNLLEVERRELVLDDLVQKSEGVFLCAQFLVDFIRANCSTILTLEQLHKTLPAGISCVYQLYFHRLEDDLCKELNITEERFLCFLSAIAAAREPLPLGFVPKFLCKNLSSAIAMRTVSKAIAIVSSLLPVHDDRIHFFHKSVKDWLTDKSRYGQHSFSVEEMEGHKILFTFCSYELDELKRKGVSKSQSFTDTTRYALEHGVQHMLQLDQDTRSCSLEEVAGNYVLDPEVLYAKIFVNIATATEDVVCVTKRGGLETISTECHETLLSLLVVLKKYRLTLEEHPFTIFQSLLNEGSSKLSSESRQLLETKYSDIPYMEYLSKNVPQGPVQGRFDCCSPVVCFEVSPCLEFMVCECRDGSIQLWSLDSGNLKWKRYVKPKHFKSTFRPFRIIHTDHAFQPACRYLPTGNAFYRSVVFHPTKDVILPGVLSHAYSLNGDLKPLFPTSKCSFSVCSIFGDEILTDCPNDAKCLMVWNLNNGREIDRHNRDNDILSFAMSRDGKLVAISHSTGCVCLVDRENGFLTLSKATLECVCGVIRFSPDSRFLWCSYFGSLPTWKGFCLRVTEGPEHHFSMEVANVFFGSWNSFELESHRIGGFLLGDSTSYQTMDQCFDVVLNSQSLLRHSMRHADYIEMVYRNPPQKNTGFPCVQCLRFSLTGEGLYAIVYDRSHKQRIVAWDGSNGDLKRQKEVESVVVTEFVPLKHGILFASKSTLELWKFDLSVCKRRWMFGTDALFRISDDQVACKAFNATVGIILDSVSGEYVKTFTVPRGDLMDCHRDLQIIAWDDKQGQKFVELRQLGKTEPLWCRRQDFLIQGSFSPEGKFVILNGMEGFYVVDAVSGNVCVKLCAVHSINNYKFVSDEECVVLRYFSLSGTSPQLQLFNVRSGNLLCVMAAHFNFSLAPLPLATCPRRGLIAFWSHQGLHIIRIQGI